MTIHDARQTLRAIGFNLRKIEGEFQIKPQGASWSGPHVYFTNDLEDAVGTARAEAARSKTN